MAEAGQIARDLFFGTSAMLLGWRYVFTSPSLPVLLRAGSMADWNPESWPLKQALEQFGDESIQLVDALRLAAAFIPNYFLEIVLPDRRNAVTIALLNQLARRGDGLKGVLALERALPFTFGVNVLGADEAAGLIKAWRRARGNYPLAF